MDAPLYSKNGFSLKAISASAVRDAAGTVHIGLTNVDPNHARTIRVKLDALNVNTVSGRILTAAAMDAHNSFDAPNVVRPAPFAGASISGRTLTVALPAKSIVMLDLR